MNQLFYGDNLSILREHIDNDSVDLVYLDPPFNSNRSYNVLFKNKSGMDAAAQIEAFDDTWTWSQDALNEYTDIVMNSPLRVGEAIEAMRKLLGDNDMLAYLVMMTSRLVELHRVLRKNGSLYLHCDPTASHYLKIILDAIFGAQHFRGEITWLRTSTHNDAKRWSPNSDVILYYAKGPSPTWNPVYLPYDDDYIKSKYTHKDDDGRPYMRDNITSPNPRPNLTYEWKGHQPPPNGWRYSVERMTELDEQGRIWYPSDKKKRPRLKRYLDEQKGVVAGNVWTDIDPINSRAKERLGYPTQKPLALMERILAASSNEGDVVLDPFCGCGTTIDAAERLERKWVGIDITYLSVDLIRKRLRDTHGDKVEKTYELHGIPQDVSGAQAMFNRNAFEFERWAVSLIDGQPNEKQVGDKGIDGIVRFPKDQSSIGKVIVSVKGGKQLNPAMVRDLIGTVDSQRSEMGVLLTMHEPTRGMVEAAKASGTFEHEFTGRSFPKVQILSVPQIMSGKAVNMPTPLNPYTKAKQHAGYQLTFGEA